RSAVIASFRSPPAAEPQPTAQKGADNRGAAPPARGPGAPAAGGYALRGRALDRPDLARTARPHRRAGRQSPRPIDRDVPSRIPAALDRSTASDDVGAQSSGPARPDCFG